MQCLIDLIGGYYVLYIFKKTLRVCSLHLNNFFKWMNENTYMSAKKTCIAKEVYSITRLGTLSGDFSFLHVSSGVISKIELPYFY